MCACIHPTRQWRKRGDYQVGRLTGVYLILHPPPSPTSPPQTLTLWHTHTHSSKGMCP